jgi:hypothetical protein
MKKTLFILLGTLATCIFAEDIDLPSIQPISTQAHTPSKTGFFYVRFIAADNDLSSSSMVPGLGIGYRRLAGNGAADISFSGLGHKESSSHKYFWTAPKASYLYYLSPEAQEVLI